MTRSWLPCLIVSTVALHACGPASPEMQLVEDVAEAMGGARAIAAGANFVVEGKGRAYRLGQNKNPYGDLPYFEVESYRREIDLQSARWRLELVQTSQFLTGNPAFRQKQVLGLDGEIAYTVPAEGNARRLAAQVARDRRAEYYHHPLTLLRAALTQAATVSNLRQEGDQQVVDVALPEGDVYTLYVTAETNHPSRIVSNGYDPNLGDVTLVTELSDYGETGGFGGFQARLEVPRRLTVRMDDYSLWDLRVSTSYDQDVADLAAPADARSAEAPASQPTVAVEEIAQGVWLLGGQSHHSVLIEFPQFLALVEAPQHDARTLGVIEKAKEIQPQKPLRYLINTHHHFDHSGGIRAAVAQGLTIVTHDINRKLLETMVARPHSRQPDALAKAPQPLTIETVIADDRYEIRDGNRVLELYRVVDDLHADGMLIAYLPRERLLIQADLFSPTAAAAPFAPNLLKNIQTRKLRVDRIVPIHGTVAPLAALEKVVKMAVQRTN